MNYQHNCLEIAASIHKFVPRISLLTASYISRMIYMVCYLFAQTRLTMEAKTAAPSLVTAAKRQCQLQKSGVARNRRLTYRRRRRRFRDSDPMYAIYRQRTRRPLTTPFCESARKLITAFLLHASGNRVLFFQFICLRLTRHLVKCVYTVCILFHSFDHNVFVDVSID